MTPPQHSSYLATLKPNFSLIYTYLHKIMFFEYNCCALPEDDATMVETCCTCNILILNYI